MDLRQHIGLDDQRRIQPFRLGLAGQGEVEPGKGPVIGCIGQYLLRATAADAEQTGQRAIAAAGQVTQLGQHSAIQPAQQFRAFAAAFAIIQQIGIGGHCIAQFLPVTNRRADIAQGDAKRRFQLAPLARVDPRGFDIDHRFLRGIAALACRDGQQFAAIGPLDRNHRMHQPVDRQALRGNRGGYRIDQKRHVLVHYRDAHETPLVAGRYQRDDRFARTTLHRCGQQECGRIGDFCCFERSIAGKQGTTDPVRQGLSKGLVEQPVNLASLRQ